MRVRAMFYTSALLFIAAGILHPQDSHYGPEGQQIPTPNCLEMGAAWEGGQMLCAPNEHKVWLTDITHWRNEQRVRVAMATRDTIWRRSSGRNRASSSRK